MGRGGGFLLSAHPSLPAWIGPAVTLAALSGLAGAFAWLVLGLRPRKLRARATHRGANGSATATLARLRFEWPTASR